MPDTGTTTTDNYTRSVLCSECGDKYLITSAEVVVPAGIERYGQELIKLTCGHYRIGRIPKILPPPPPPEEVPKSVQEQIKEIAAATPNWQQHCRKCDAILMFNNIVARDNNRYARMFCEKCNKSYLINTRNVPAGRDEYWFAFYQYQKESLIWAEEFATVDGKTRCLFADPAGMGKTVEALSWLRYHKEKAAPVLFVVKSKLRYQWLREINQWMAHKWGEIPKGVDIPLMIDSPALLKMTASNFYVISMDYLGRITDEIAEHGFKTFVVDESQNFKGMDRQRTRTLRYLLGLVPDRTGQQNPNPPENIIFLSGTPLLNRADEYFVTLNALDSQSWRYQKNYVRDWCDTTSEGKVGGILEYARDEFFQRTERYILRRDREDYFDALPTVSHKPTVFEIDNPNFIQSYNTLRLELATILNKAIHNDPEKARMNIIALLTRLRELVAIAKVPECAEFVNNLVEEKPNRKILIGLHHHSVRILLMDALSHLNPVRIDGELNSAQAQEQLDKFMYDDKHQVLLASQQACGEGVDGIQKVCSTAVMIERNWNAAREAQFIGRIHRNLQKENVDIFYLLAKGSLDQWISDLIEKKRYYINTADNLKDRPDEDMIETNWMGIAQDIVNNPMMAPTKGI